MPSIWRQNASETCSHLFSFQNVSSSLNLAYCSTIEDFFRRVIRIALKLEEVEQSSSLQRFWKKDSHLDIITRSKRAVNEVRLDLLVNPPFTFILAVIHKSVTLQKSGSAQSWWRSVSEWCLSYDDRFPKSTFSFSSPWAAARRCEYLLGSDLKTVLTTFVVS